MLNVSGDYEKLFLKSILKFTLILLKRSCYKVSLNFTKLLLKLNPVDDPMGSLIMIDHVAILAKDFDWLENFIHSYGNDYITKGTSIKLYPNFIYSFSLCKFEEYFNGKNYEEISPEIGKIDLSTFDDLFTWNWDGRKNDHIFWLALSLVLYP